MTALLLAAVLAADPITDVAAAVGPKVVKLFGAGGFRGVSNYGVGVLVSADGLVLTAAGPMLDTPDLVAHLHDGRRLAAKLVATEPRLDAAVVRLSTGGKPPVGLSFFDLTEAAGRPSAAAGDWVLGFGNMFEIAVRDEPLTVQHGVIAAVTPLTGRRGTFGYDLPGPVYVVDAITNNPGAAGGPLTDSAGRLLGLIGRELKNTQTETWVNYAVPVSAKVPGKTVGFPEFVAAAAAGKYVAAAAPAKPSGPAGFHGIVLVPDVLERTPPYVDRVIPGSPAERAGLRPDDLIAFVNGDGVATVRAFRATLAALPPGATVRLEVRRGGRLEAVELTLAAAKSPVSPKR